MAFSSSSGSVNEKSPLLINASSTELSTYWNELPRWLLRDPWFSRLSTLPIFRYHLLGHSPSVLGEPGNGLEMTTQEANRRIWIEGRPVPLTFAKNVRAGLMQHFYLRGKTWVTEIAWPLTIAGLTIYDLTQFYQYPNLRYGLSIWDIFTGSADNSLIESTRLGSPLPHEFFAYSFGTVMLFSAPLINGVAQALLNRILLRKSHRDNPPYFFKQLIALILWKKTIEETENVELSLEFGEQPAYDFNEQLFHYIKQTTGFARLQALSACADLVDAFYQTEALKHTGQQALAFLDKTAKTELTSLTRLPSYLYANYLLISLGSFIQIDDRHSRRDIYTRRVIQALLALLSFSARTYARYRIYRLLIQKLITYLSYVEQKSNCATENKIFQYDSETAEYTCTYCGDWPFVYKPLANSIQACIDGLLKQPLPAKNLTAGMQRLLSFGSNNITSINLHHQNWLAWQPQDWQAFLNTLNGTIRQLEKLNLSQAQYQPSTNTTVILKALATFIKQVEIHSLDLSNQGLGNGKLCELIPGIANNTAIQTFLLAGMNLGDESLTCFADVLSTIQPRELNINGNILSDNASAYFLKQLINQTLDSLDLSDNSLSQLGMNEAARMLTKNIVTRLILSKNNLQNVDFTEFNHAVTSGQLLELIIQNSNLGDIEIAQLTTNFSHSNLTAVDISGNTKITTIGIEVLSKNLLGAPITRLGLARLKLQDPEAYRMLGEIFGTLPLRALDISENPLTSPELNIVLQSLQNSTLLEFNLAGVPINQNNMKPLLAHLHNASLQQFNLSSTGLQYSQIAQLIPALLQQQLLSLDISHNHLGNNITRILEQHARTGLLQKLFLSQTSITHESIPTLLKMLRESTITTLEIDHDLIADTGGQTLAIGLISKIENPYLLSQPSLPRDFAKQLRQARSTTPLNALSLRDSSIGNNTAKSICRVTARTKIKINQLELSDNPGIDPEEIEIESCHIFSASRRTAPTSRLSAMQASTFFRSSNTDREDDSSSSNTNHQHTAAILLSGCIPIVGTIMLLFLFYDLLKKCFRNADAQNDQDTQRITKKF